VPSTRAWLLLLLPGLGKGIHTAIRLRIHTALRLHPTLATGWARAHHLIKPLATRHMTTVMVMALLRIHTALRLQPTLATGWARAHHLIKPLATRHMTTMMVLALLRLHGVPPRPSRRSSSERFSQPHRRPTGR